MGCPSAPACHVSNGLGTINLGQSLQTSSGRSKQLEITHCRVAYHTGNAERSWAGSRNLEENAGQGLRVWEGRGMQVYSEADSQFVPFCEGRSSRSVGAMQGETVGKSSQGGPGPL